MSAAHGHGAFTQVSSFAVSSRWVPGNVIYSEDVPPRKGLISLPMWALWVSSQPIDCLFVHCY